MSLGGLTVITGPNGSGKSNVYRALRPLAATIMGVSPVHSQRHWGSIPGQDLKRSAARCMTAKRMLRVGVTKAAALWGSMDRTQVSQPANMLDKPL